MARDRRMIAARLRIRGPLHDRALFVVEQAQTAGGRRLQFAYPLANSVM